MEKVKIGKYSFDGDEWFVVSSDAKAFIGRMLEKGTLLNFIVRCK